MIPIPVFAYKWIAIGVVVLALGLAAWAQTARLHAVKAEYAGFVARVDAIGKAQEAAAKIRDAENKARMERANADNARIRRDLAGLYDSYGRLRDQRPGGSILPGPAAGAGSPAVASFDRAGIDRALSDFDRGVTALVKRGDEAIADLNTAKTWAQAK